MEFRRPSFISMDPPRHDEQRKMVSPIVAPANLQQHVRHHPRAGLQGSGRAAARRNLRLGAAGLDRADDADADHAVRLPEEDRAKLTYWSDCRHRRRQCRRHRCDSEEKRLEILTEALRTFTAMWHERAGEPPGFDLISMLAHGEATRNMVNDPQEFLGNLMLLIVGGNDTTRNSMSGGLLGAVQASRPNIRSCATIPALIPSMVPEIIRWQSPIVHMRRTAVADAELGGKQIKAGRQGGDVVHLGQPR